MLQVFETLHLMCTGCPRINALPVKGVQSVEGQIRILKQNCPGYHSLETTEQ
jgi:hypothetical protein